MAAMNATTPELKNIFQAAADWQRMPSEIRAAVMDLGLIPAGRYNGLALYSPEQLERVAQHLAGESEASGERE